MPAVYSTHRKNIFQTGKVMSALPVMMLAAKGEIAMSDAIHAYENLEALPEICRAADVLAVLPVSHATLYRAAARGAIPCFRVGRRVLFSREHLLRWLDGELAAQTFEKKVV